MPTTPAVPLTRTPNQFHLHGSHITVSYYPDGFGPIEADEGPTVLTYHDPHRSLTFRAKEVRTVEVPDVGTIVSVTLLLTVDAGSTTFSLVVPAVAIPQNESSVTIHTDAITTAHHFSIGGFGFPQRETYSVTALTGTAAVGILPL